MLRLPPTCAVSSASGTSQTTRGPQTLSNSVSARRCARSPTPSRGPGAGSRGTRSTTARQGATATSARTVTARWRLPTLRSPSPGRARRGADDHRPRVRRAAQPFEQAVITALLRRSVRYLRELLAEAERREQPISRASPARCSPGVRASAAEQPRPGSATRASHPQAKENDARTDLDRRARRRPRAAIRRAGLARRPPTASRSRGRRARPTPAASAALLPALAAGARLPALGRARAPRA